MPQKVVYPPAVANLLEEFRNEVLCRNDANQAKAGKIWRNLHPLLRENESREISVEWGHYLMCEHTTDEFGEMLKKIESKYRTI